MNSEVFEYQQSKSVKFVNQCLEDIGETLITKRKLQSKKYSEQKLEDLTVMIGKAVIREATTGQSKDKSEIIEQLKEKFQSIVQRVA